MKDPWPRLREGLFNPIHPGISAVSLRNSWITYVDGCQNNQLKAREEMKQIINTYKFLKFEKPFFSS